MAFPDSISNGNLSDLIETLEIDNAQASASISLWGGQLLSFKPKHDGRERLFMSEKIILDGNQALRAGVPVCWPWFAKKEDYQKHGLVRTQHWQVLSASDTADYTEVVLTPNTTKGSGFDGTASLILTIQVGKRLRCLSR